MNKDINESEQTACSNCGGELKGKPMYLNSWCDDCLKQLLQVVRSDSLISLFIYYCLLFLVKMLISDYNK